MPPRGAALGYGAAAVNPYLAVETVRDLVRRGRAGGHIDQKAEANLLKALGKGVLKIMSKMGVSTVASYTGAQIFEAIGLGHEVDQHLLRRDHLPARRRRLRRAGRGDPAAARGLAWPDRRRSWLTGGWRPAGSTSGAARASRTCSTRRRCSSCSTPPAAAGYEIFKEYTSLVDDQARQLMTLRGLLRIRGVDGAQRRAPVPIDEVEPVAAIVRRFATGAMSYGSISAEAHETLAIAMNRIGGRSNTGEGGEDPDRFAPDANGDLRRSAVKQVASGRFGVTSEYLVNADDLQIKMAQGAKPGEGGQLPGNKVYPWIAKTRHSTPGVGLISPPPHHDIYSIEDLAQLIHDLKNANPAARVHVKLVAEVGVGTVAAGRVQGACRRGADLRRTTAAPARRR